MGELNLESRMQVPAPVEEIVDEIEVVDPIVFDFPEKVLEKVSDLNTTWQDSFSKKLTGRLLAGSIKKLMRQLDTLNDSVEKARKSTTEHRHGLRQYVQSTLTANIQTFQHRLLELIADLDGRLTHAHKYNEVRFPNGTDPLVLALIKAGLFADVKPNQAMKHLAPKFKHALGISLKDLPPPYTKQQLGQQSSLEEAIKVLEELHSFVNTMNHYKVESRMADIDEDHY